MKTKQIKTQKFGLSITVGAEKPTFSKWEILGGVLVVLPVCVFLFYLLLLAK